MEQMSFPDEMMSEVLSFQQAMAYLKISENHLRRLKKDGELKHSKSGDRVLFRLSDLRAYVEATQKTQSAQ